MNPPFHIREVTTTKHKGNGKKNWDTIRKKILDTTPRNTPLHCTDISDYVNKDITYWKNEITVPQITSVLSGMTRLGEAEKVKVNSRVNHWKIL